MSINWVMLHDQEGFIPLPNERFIYKSPSRTSLSLQPLSSYTGKDPFSVQCSAGCVHLTNQRVIYLPAQKTEQFQSFSAPLLNIHDSHVSAPFFGPNVWTAVIQPVPGGGIPATLPAIQLKLTFKEGGAFDYHTNFERIKERLLQAVETSREGGLRTVDLSTVDLEELPAYEGPANGTTYTSQIHPDAGSEACPYNGPPPGAETEPLDPPPGYEEVQQQSVATELEERLRRSS
ncbi:hypothetical protein MAP00_003678 [Monascus purpureus]|nr:hypothetical protein MAP00_003678 [Monascus purpureus]